MITGINGNKFSIEVTEGVFHQGEYAYVFRSPDFDSTSRLDRGAIAFEDAVAYTNTSGTGIVTRILAADGAHVEEGIRYLLPWRPMLGNNGCPVL